MRKKGNSHSDRPAGARTSALVPVLVAALIFTGAARANTLDDVTAASNQARLTVDRALAEEDAGLLASIFTENAVVISSGGQSLKGRSTIRASATLAFLTLGSGRLEVSRRYLTVVDSIGYETGRFLFRRDGEDESGPALSGSYTLLWEMENGAWKVSRALGL